MHKNQMFKGEKKLCHQTSEDLDIYNQNLLKIREGRERKGERGGGGSKRQFPNYNLNNLKTSSKHERGMLCTILMLQKN